MWNWEQKDWPNFTYDQAALADLELEFIKIASECFGVFKHISDEDKEQIKIEIISEEALKTSEIEGEFLDRDSVQSSISKQFGLRTDQRRISAAEQGIAEMMVLLYRNFDNALDHETLFSWHRMLMKGRISIEDIGAYRTHDDPMRIVSGAIHDPKIHFQAPPSVQITDEMDQFVLWFNQSAPDEKNMLPALTRAGIAHLYFESIHPFEDGNGRIGRAISEQALAQNLGYPSLIALAYTIERNKKAYYTALEENSKSNEITEWLVYFGQTILDAQIITQKRIEFILTKDKLFRRLQGQLNERQEKVLNRMFREGIDGFKGGLSVSNYIAITKTTRPTATRDLRDLVNKEALLKIGQLKSTRYHLNLTDR